MRNRFKFLPVDTRLIHGDCRGADKLAASVALEFGFDVHPYPADWDKHGDAAGPIRNRQMLDLKPDLVIAFHANYSKSKGTKDCVTEARKRKIPVQLITGRDEDRAMNYRMFEQLTKAHWEVLWEEDECLLQDPDAERTPKAFKRLFGIECNEADKLQTFDCGDSFWHRYPNGIWVVHSYDGHDIRRLKSETLEDAT